MNKVLIKNILILGGKNEKNHGFDYGIFDGDTSWFLHCQAISKCSSSVSKTGIGQIKTRLYLDFRALGMERRKVLLDFRTLGKNQKELCVGPRPLGKERKSLGVDKRKVG